MNIPTTTGTSPCKRQENGDRTKESERPLKKARFAWQVKGKYHLRNKTSENINCETVKSEDPGRAGSSSGSISRDREKKSDQNLEILGDYLLNQEQKKLDSVINNSNKTFTPKTSTPNKFDYRRQVPSSVKSFCQTSTVSARKSSTKTAYPALPSSTTLSQSASENQCIARWQAKQMAKSIVDNSINHVLDSWLVSHLPAESEGDWSLALDVADFINNLPGDNTVENEGILMAISAHGLQSASSLRSCNINSSAQDNVFNHKIETYPSPPSSPKSDDDGTSVSLNRFEHIQASSSRNVDMTWSLSEETMRKNVNNLTQLALFPNKSPQYPYFNKTENLQTANLNNIMSNNCDFENNLDFLDAAVSFAIQNKGLQSYGTDYG